MYLQEMNKDIFMGQKRIQCNSVFLGLDDCLDSNLDPASVIGYGQLLNCSNPPYSYIIISVFWC